MNLFKYCIFLIVLSKDSCSGLTAYFSQHGLHGNLTIQEIENVIYLKTNFKTFKNISEEAWSWKIHEFPVNYENIFGDLRCDILQVGKILYDLEDIFGKFVPSDQIFKQFNSSILKEGIKSFWGRSIVLHTNNWSICSSLLTDNTDYENVAEAKFRRNVVGSIIFKSISSNDGLYTRTLIFTDLMYAPSNKSTTSYKKITSNSWKIFTTDIFDNNDEESNCNNLQILYDPYNTGIEQSVGDLDIRLGKLQLNSFSALNANKQVFVDKTLLLTPNDYATSTRKLYIVLYDDTTPNNYLSCAKIRPVRPRTFKAEINGNGLKGQIVWKQKFRFEPTYVNVLIGSVHNNTRSWLEYARDLGNIFISDLPPMSQLVGQSKYCSVNSTGKLYNPSKLPGSSLPDEDTQDKYFVGDMTRKLWKKQINSLFQLIPNSYELNGDYWDLFCPLSGVHSILNRGLVITRKQNDKFIPWTCGSILSYEHDNIKNQVKMTTAVVIFKYPIVGKILFRQPTSLYWEDTTILVEYLIHADGGSVNTTRDHRWAINKNMPAKDFYDWQNRCVSTGDVFNPLNLYSDPTKERETCFEDFLIACRIGELSNMAENLLIAGNKDESVLSRKLFTIPNLPLSGKNNILGRSVVIYDDFGPKARGDRLACSMIKYLQPRKALVKDWLGNGQFTNLMGKIEFTQQSQYDKTYIEKALIGLLTNNILSIHEVPVAINLEFPCEISSLGKTYDPFKISSKSSISDFDIFDSFGLMDLNGKFSNILESKQTNENFSDNLISLFGYQSIIGRSIAVVDINTKKHVACGTIERGYSGKESRESRAIASFHHPLGFAYGYVRLSQLIGLISGQSDTTIEVNLRYPGQHDRNKTRNHLFKIYVNPVGVDAIVKETVTRCTAGGYVWNPYYTQLADPLNDELYKNECGPDNPYRCYVGDVSARLGTIDIGYERKVFTDSNFPLDGAVSAVGKSIVIFGPERSSEIFACANIEPDHDIIKYVNIERPPRFVTAQFLEDVREIMGVPEWFLEVDSRKTKLLYDNACVQIVVHFRGPIAARLEQDFSRLLASGRLDSPSLYIPGYQNSKRKTVIQHKECKIKDNKKSVGRNMKRKQDPVLASCCFISRVSILLHAFSILITRIY